jgi:hypothetical protein
MTYVKCYWDETRADAYDAWGCSWWFFEAGPDGAITRNVVVFDNGVRLRYGPDHMKDQFGGLAEARLQQMDMPGPEVITAEEFEGVWESVKSNGMVH